MEKNKRRHRIGERKKMFRGKRVGEKEEIPQRLWNGRKGGDWSEASC